MYRLLESHIIARLFNLLLLFFFFFTLSFKQSVTTRLYNQPVLKARLIQSTHPLESFIGLCKWKSLNGSYS